MTSYDLKHTRFACHHIKRPFPQFHHHHQINQLTPQCTNKQTNKHMSAYGGSSENFSFFSNLLLGAATARSRLRSLYSLCVRGSGSTVKCKRCVAQRQYLSNDYALRPPTSQKRILNHQEENTALPPLRLLQKKNAISRNVPSPHATCTAASTQTQMQTQNARWLVVLSIYLSVLVASLSHFSLSHQNETSESPSVQP